jgi:hypothetical protein
MTPKHQDTCGRKAAEAAIMAAGLHQIVVVVVTLAPDGNLSITSTADDTTAVLKAAIDINDKPRIIDA